MQVHQQLKLKLTLRLKRYNKTPEKLPFPLKRSHSHNMFFQPSSFERAGPLVADSVYCIYIYINIYWLYTSSRWRSVPLREVSEKRTKHRSDEYSSWMESWYEQQTTNYILQREDWLPLESFRYFCRNEIKQRWVHGSRHNYRKCFIIATCPGSNCSGFFLQLAIPVKNGKKLRSGICNLIIGFYSSPFLHFLGKTHDLDFL